MTTTGSGRPLPDDLDRIRRVILILDRIGASITRATDDAGLGEWSSHVAIGVLSTLTLDGQSRPSALTGPTKLTRGGLSNLLERLERAGLVTRQYGAVPGDRRGAIVTITKEGTETLTAINELAARTMKRHDQSFEELAALLRTDEGARSASATRRPRVSPRWLESLARLGSELDEVFAAAGLDDPTPVRSLIALCCAAAPDGTRPNELIEQTGLSSGGVSQLLDRLEQADLIRRRTGMPPDRRAVFVDLTDEGRAELERRLRLVSIERLRDAIDVD